MRKLPLSKLKQGALKLADESGHGKAFVISYPDKLLTTPYLRPQQQHTFIDYAKFSHQTQSIGLYLHLPFCEQKCSFCNFAVSVNHQEDYQSNYVDALLYDMKKFFDLYQGKIHSVDIGGGTPLLLSEKNLIKVSEFLQPILNKIEDYDPTKFSFEQTSKLAALHPEKMKALTSAFPSLPVRTSMGIQSVNQSILADYRRVTTNIGSEEANPAENCRRVLPKGSHASADIIFPMGELEDFIQTINRTVELQFDTITAYDIIDNYGGGIRKAFRGKSNVRKEKYGQFYDVWYQKMIQFGYVVRYGSNNAVKKTKLNEYLLQKGFILSNLTEQEYLDFAAKFSVSSYYHDRISLGNEFIGFGLGASSKLIYNNIPIWSFNHSNIPAWKEERNQQRNKEQLEKNYVYSPKFAYSYSFPTKIWMTKDIRYQLGNFGCIQFKHLNEKYRNNFPHLLKIEDLFEKEIEFVLNQGWMEWKEDQRLCLKVGGTYTYLAHIRALLTDDLLLPGILDLYEKEDVLQQVYAKRQEIEKHLQI
mmetsp:Transcript_28469/g.31093  ORF Transcript_28469/g.31093 Transcript_28469/m.31093 type:complete len:531 (+) Transcript_28469:55-1647(+)